MKHLRLILVVALVAAFFQAGCRIGDFSDSIAGNGTDISGGASEGPANVKFKIVIPTEDTQAPAATIRAGTGVAKITCRLILVNTGNASQPTIVITRTGTVSDGGTFQTSFPGLACQPIIGELVVEDGNISGKTDFHGAMDLIGGENELSVSPKGCRNDIDIVANVVMSIAQVPSLVGAAPRMLVTAVTTAGSGKMDNPDETVYSEVLERFLDGGVSPTDTAPYVKISSSFLDRRTLIGMGPGVSWKKTSAEIWAGTTFSTGNMIVERIIRQGFGGYAYVSWASPDRQTFAVTKINAQTGARMSWTGHTSGAGRFCQALPMGETLVIGASYQKKPLVFRWDGKADAVFTGTTQPNLKWIQRFNDLTINNDLTFPPVNFLEYDYGFSRINCMVCDPATRLPKLYRLDSESGTAIASSTPAFAAWARAEQSAATIGWDKIPGAESYNLTWATTSNMSAASGTRITGVTCPYVHTGLTNGTTYWYVVTAVIGGVETQSSIKVQATPNESTLIRPSPLHTLAAGWDHALAIKSDGTVWSWGYNEFGELGILQMGWGTYSPVPVQVFRIQDAISVAAGYHFSVALRKDGTVWTWGCNDNGQLGNGTTVNSTRPVMVTHLTGVKAIAAGTYSSYALREDGTVWAWGKNSYGQLGNGTTSNSSIPVQVANLSNIVDIAAGCYFGLALQADGTVRAWGDNAQFQLGDGTTQTRMTPVAVLSLSGVRSIAAGSPYDVPHSLALKDDGSLWAWGNNSYGQLGMGNNLIGKTPTQVTTVSNLARISAGSAFSCGIDREGNLWTWGLYKSGNLGYAASNYQNSPIKLTNLTNVVDVVCGADFMIAKKRDGTLWAWGENSHGQLGDSTSTDAIQPVKVADPDLLPPKDSVTVASPSIQCGGDSYYGASFALATDGHLWSWGDNDYGQLGDGTSWSRIYPDKLWGLSGIRQFDVGKSFCLAVLQSGSIWGWGRNGNGQLGDDTTTNHSRPVQVYGALNFTFVSAGEDHTLAIKKDGGLWAWGSNNCGQLGNKTTVSSNRPVKVLSSDGQTSLSGVSMCVAGDRFSLVQLQDGSIWAWGYDNYGTLGNLTVSSQSALPVRVQGLNSVQALSAQGDFALALKDGMVFSWGNGNYGKLGLGNSTWYDTPQKIPNFEGIQYISAGSDHSLAIMSGGTVWAWGSGYTNRPERLPGLSDIVQVSAGDNHDLAVRNDGVVFSWGNNLEGQLGRTSLVNPDPEPKPVWRLNTGIGRRLPNASDTPAIPLNVAAESGSGKNINVSWSAVDDAWAYNIYYSAFPDVSKTTGTRITNVTSPYIHNGLQPGATYYYVVTAVNGELESAESAVVSSIPAE